MIEIRNLSFHYGDGDFSLWLPQLTVDDGVSVAFVGPSGFGKTTLLNLISGVLRPTAGQIVTADYSISDLDERQRREFRLSRIGLVFQEFELLEYLNVLDNILHPYRITGALKLDKDVCERAVTLAQDMGIGDKLKRAANDLSQGEKQRVAICRALLPRPKLILADEATGNLDPVNKLRILELLFRSVETYQATLLAVTHDQELLACFDRVADFQDFQDGNGA